MKNHLFSRIKNQSPFKKADVVVYLLVALFTLAMFLSFVIFAKTSVSGFYVSVGDEKILYYDFSTVKYDVYKNEKYDVLVTNNDTTITFKVQSTDGKYNVISVDKKGNKVSVSGANCPHGDCTKFSPISTSDTNKLIYCAAHDLRVVAISNSSYTPPSTNGGVK